MAVALFASLSLGCSNILITPGASASGHAMIAYNADDAALHGAISHWPAAKHPKGAMRPIYSWDLGRYLGSIPEPATTYNVMGNANDQGLVIGETTLGGLKELSNVGKDYRNGTILDYGQLIWVTLQRAKTAREAIALMHKLTTEFGYASDMEGFSIGDASGEVWYLEFIGKGGFEKGAVWVALRVPDGHIAAHANQARITQFLPCDDPNTCMMAPDTVTFAIKRGYWKGAPDDTSFSFSDIYDPLTFSGARFCEARVWAIFSTIANASTGFDSSKYLAYAQGFNLTTRMPLFVKPAMKLTRDEVHDLMSHHFQKTWFDPSLDVGAGAEHSPYRWNGLEWGYKDKTYVNERIVGTHYTAWHYVAEIDGSKPKPMAALLHWGADDHSWSPKIPVHGGATTLHPSYDDFNCTGRDACRAEAGLPGTVTDFSLDSAWWVNQIVADQVYSRKDRAAMFVRSERAKLEKHLDGMTKETEASATKLFVAGKYAEGIAYLNAHAVAVGKYATETWVKVWQDLMVKFVDGKITTIDKKNEVCGCKKATAEFSDEWKEKVIKDTGDHYLEPASAVVAAAKRFHDKPAIDKRDVKGVVA